MIKANTPPEFILEWFLKSLLPYIVKDVLKYGVTTKEHAIFIGQQLDLIYAHSRILYDTIPNGTWSNHDPNFKHEPQDDGIIGNVSAKAVDQVTYQTLNFLLNQFYGWIGYDFFHHHPISGCTFYAIIGP